MSSGMLAAVVGLAWLQFAYAPGSIVGPASARKLLLDTTPAPKNIGFQQCGGLVLSLYDQCGGETNCPSGVSCSDSQWPVGCCPAGHSCTRSSHYYWQCLPETVSLPSPTVYNIYAQCGGQSNCPATSGSCSDDRWYPGSCAPGSECTRATNWYWQCLPGGTEKAVAILGTGVRQPWQQGAFVDKDAQWIWTIQGATQDAPVTYHAIKFRKTFSWAGATPLPVVVRAYADNYAYFSMNGGSIGAAYWGPWGEAQFEGTLQLGSNLLQIDAFNVDGPAGLLVTIINKASGEVMFHTDRSWTWQADD